MAKTELDVSEEEEKPETFMEDEHKRKKKKKKRKKEKVHLKIETISEHPEKISPIVGYFPSGYDAIRGQSSGQKEPPPLQQEVKVFRHEKRTNRLQLVVSPNGSQVDFVGTNYSGEAATPQLCTYALGILDKQSQTLKIVPIASNKILRLEPRVRGLDTTDKEPLKEALTAEKKAEKMRDLTVTYSTKTSINKAKKLESLHQKVDPKTQEDLDRKIEGIKINKKALESAAGTHNARNIPPYDSTATTPGMAYPLDKIILTGEWDYLVDILKLTEVGAEVAPEVYPSFVRNRIYRLEDIKDEMEKTRLACVFSYINHLIKFNDKHSIGASSSVKYHKIPSILLQKFSSMFADSDSKWLQAERQDLLISYVLVLTLIADDFRTDSTDIARDLRMTPIKLRQYFENLGCKHVREGGVLLTTLPVPLQFPKIRRRRGRE